MTISSQALRVTVVKVQRLGNTVCNAEDEPHTLKRVEAPCPLYMQG